MLYSAPLAGLTHSAFRRLVTDFGGCDMLWTEMLSGRAVLREDFATSPYLKRPPAGAKLVYQLMLAEGDPVDEIAARVAAQAPDGIDINLACHAPDIRNRAAGSRLFEAPAALAGILAAVRRQWAGPFYVKIRLGHDRPGWEERFTDNLRLFEDAGVNSIILHPRFFEDRFRRHVRHERLAWAAGLTRLPLIANGDLTGPDIVRARPEVFAPAAGLMIGRWALVQPWIFAAWRGLAPRVDYAEVWQRMFDYIVADFPADVALTRVKMFAKYYAANFQFGHEFHKAVSNAPALNIIRVRAGEFFSRAPEILRTPALLAV